MALAHFSKDFGIAQAKISKMTGDPSGGSAAYATSVSLVGSKKMNITGAINTKYLRGDNMLLDSDTVIDSISAAVDYAKLSLDALAVMFTTAVVDSGTTPNQLATWGLKNTDSLQYFKLEGRSASADMIGGDVLFSLWKCKLSAFPATGLAEEDYQVPAASVTVLPRISDNKWLDTVIRETFAVLT